jgi:hypothetical protein
MIQAVSAQPLVVSFRYSCAHALRKAAQSINQSTFWTTRFAPWGTIVPWTNVHRYIHETRSICSYYQTCERLGLQHYEHPVLGCK